MHEMLPQIIFYVFAGLTILSAFLVITQNNPVRCVLFLVLAFLTSAVLWMLVHAEFLAFILVLVYVGAVMTLFLFVVMMLNIDVESMKSLFIRYLPFGLTMVALLVGLLLAGTPKGAFNTAVEVSVTAAKTRANEYSPDELVKKPVAVSNSEALGLVLYTDYVYAFELAAVILLVAIVAAISLVHRRSIRSKQQNILDQLMTTKEGRLKLVKMESVK